MLGNRRGRFVEASQKQKCELCGTLAILWTHKTNKGTKVDICEECVQDFVPVIPRSLRRRARS